MPKLVLAHAAKKTERMELESQNRDMGRPGRARNLARHSTDDDTEQAQGEDATPTRSQILPVASSFGQRMRKTKSAFTTSRNSTQSKASNRSRLNTLFGNVPPPGLSARCFFPTVDGVFASSLALLRGRKHVQYLLPPSLRSAL